MSRRVPLRPQLPFDRSNGPMSVEERITDVGLQWSFVLGTLTKRIFLYLSEHSKFSTAQCNPMVDFGPETCSSYVDLA